MDCGESMGQGCRSCMASMFQPSQSQGTSSSESNGGRAAARCVQTVCDHTDSPSGPGAGFVLLSMMAFIGPIVVTIVVVQLLESQVGTLWAALAGLAAAASSVLMCSGMGRRLKCPSEIAGAER